MNLSLSALEGRSLKFRSYLPSNAVLIGAITTAIVTQVFISLGVIIPFEEFRREFAAQIGIWFFYNPFTTIQWLGGVFGGYVAGYYTRERWYNGFINGVKAVFLGMIIFYAFDTASILYGPYTDGVLTASLILGISAQRFIFFFLPLAGVYVFQGMVLGPIGNTIGHAVQSMSVFQLTDVDGPEYLTDLISRGSRGLFSLLVFQTIFLILWWAVYRLQNITYVY